MNIKEIDKIGNEYKTKRIFATQRQSKNKKNFTVNCYFILFLFLFIFSENKSLNKNKIKIYRINYSNIRLMPPSTDKIRTKKIASFLHDNISALLSSAGLHLNAFTSTHKTDADEITKLNLF
jgi:hypothetical protein